MSAGEPACFRSSARSGMPPGDFAARMCSGRRPGVRRPHAGRRAAAPGRAAPGRGRGKSVIMIWLRGGPSHIDSYDMKPDAPAEIRGEFKPIRTNVPGIQICEHMPLHAKIMDKLAIIRGIKSNDLGDHTPHYILTGFPDRGKRPGLRLGRQPPAAADRRPAAVRQPDVQAAGPVRQRRPDLPRPGPPAVRARRPRGWRT